MRFVSSAFGSLLTEMWKERESCVNPAHFKKCIAKFAPRFMGYDQQDAQEFLRYLLDGLHEDLNRVQVKPKLLDADVDSSLRFVMFLDVFDVRFSFHLPSLTLKSFEVAF